MANDMRLPEGFVQPDVYTAIMDRLKQDKDMVRLRDTARAMQAGPVIAGASEASRALGGGGLNLNPALAWASGLPGAPKNLGAIAQANPYQSPTDTLGKLMAMGKTSGDANDRYLTQRDKFFASTMGRPLGAAGIGAKLQLEDKKTEGRVELEDKRAENQDKLATKKMDAELVLAQKRLDAAKSEKEAAAAQRELDRLRAEKKEQEEKDIKAAAYADKKLNDLIVKNSSTVNMVLGDLRNLETIFKKYDGTGNYPGVGVLGSDVAGVAKSKDKMGYIRDAEAVKASFESLISLRNRILSGLQSTDKEFGRAIKQLGDAPWQTEELALSSIRKLSAAMAADLRAARSVMNPLTKELYQKSDYVKPEDLERISIGGIRIGGNSSPPPAGGGDETKEVRDYADKHFNGDYSKSLNFLREKRGYKGN